MYKVGMTIGRVDNKFDSLNHYLCKRHNMFTFKIIDLYFF